MVSPSSIGTKSNLKLEDALKLKIKELNEILNTYNEDEVNNSMKNIKNISRIRKNKEKEYRKHVDRQQKH